MDAALGYADSLEEDLMRELENGRMVRMMAKLGFINERPEFQMDPRYVFNASFLSFISFFLLSTLIFYLFLSSFYSYF